MSSTDDKRTALVTGATGLLGRQVVRAFERGGKWRVKGTAFSRADGAALLKVDLGEEAEVERTLEEIRPEVVVHCAANRFPDKVDKDPEGTRRLNVEASRALARLCAARDILLIYISTEYVFSGRPGEAPYEADAPTGPTNLYGQTKLDGEGAVLDEYEKQGKQGLGVVLRVPVLYGEAETNSESAINVLMDVVLAAQQGKGGKMDDWAWRCPTNTEDVARVCYDLAVRYIGDDNRASLPRVLQFSSEQKFTKYQICQIFGDIMGIAIDPIERNPEAQLTRPYDCQMSTKGLRDLGINVATQDFVGWWRRECRAFRH